MRAAIVLACLLAPVAAQAKTFGVTCQLNLEPKLQSYHFSFDSDSGQYTMRLGDQVLRQRKAYELDMGFSPGLKPFVKALKIVYANGADYWLVIEASNMTVTAASLNGSSARPIGICTDDTFKGL